MNQSEKEAVAKEIDELTERLNAKLYQAWNGKLTTTIEIVTQKFHALAGFELLDIRTYDPLGRGADSDHQGSLVERAITAADG